MRLFLVLYWWFLFFLLRNQLLKTQFNKDAMSSKAMWYILVLKLHIQCRADISVFPLKSENISIAAEFLGRSLGTSAFVGFNSFNARCILGFFKNFNTHFKLLLFSSYVLDQFSVSFLYLLSGVAEISDKPYRFLKSTRVFSLFLRSNS